MNQDKLKKNYDNWDKNLLNFVLASSKILKHFVWKKKTKLNILGSSIYLSNKKIFYLIILLVVKITTFLSIKIRFTIVTRLQI